MLCEDFINDELYDFIDTYTEYFKNLFNYILQYPIYILNI